MDKRLREIDNLNRHTSYLNKPWAEMYLRDRLPVTFSNTATFGTDLPNNVNLLDRVTSLLIHSLRFHQSLKNNFLTPDVHPMIPTNSNNPNYWQQICREPDLLATQLSCQRYNVYPLGMVKK